jgi:hypothetical protein
MKRRQKRGQRDLPKHSLNMTKYHVTYIFPQTRNPFALTVRAGQQNLEDTKKQYEAHMNETTAKGYELISVSNLGFGMWFFWKKTK